MGRREGVAPYPISRHSPRGLLRSFRSDRTFLESLDPESPGGLGSYSGPAGEDLGSPVPHHPRRFSIRVEDEGPWTLTVEYTILDTNLLSRTFLLE